MDEKGNTIKTYYPSGVIMTSGYKNKSDLIEGIKFEAKLLHSRLTYSSGSPLPLPRRIVITFDRRE